MRNDTSAHDDHRTPPLGSTAAGALTREELVGHRGRGMEPASEDTGQETHREGGIARRPGRLFAPATEGGS